MYSSRGQELCESGGGRPGLPVPDNPYGLCGRKATLNCTAFFWPGWRGGGGGGGGGGRKRWGWWLLHCSALTDVSEGKPRTLLLVC